MVEIPQGIKVFMELGCKNLLLMNKEIYGGKRKDHVRAYESNYSK